MLKTNNISLRYGKRVLFEEDFSICTLFYMKRKSVFSIRITSYDVGYTKLLRRLELNQVYGGTWNLFDNTLKTMGIEVRFVDPSDPENFRRATDDKTRAYYGETRNNFV